METFSGPKLLQQAEKILLHPIHPHLISCCPTMDLIALVTDEENLDVYRINGQRAFGLKRKSSDTTVDSICWEYNGQAIAVAWSDGYTDILSAETGKVIHKDIVPPNIGAGAPRISRIGWGLNFIDVEAVKRRTGSRKQKFAAPDTTTKVDFTSATTEEWDAFKDDTSLEDFLQRQPDLQTLDIAPDLPDQLAMMDVETLLPKLPAIPMPPVTPFMRMQPQTDPGAFGSQAQVDSLLHSHHLKDHNAVDMFIRCTDKGTVHPSIYDSLETVNVRLPQAMSLKNSRPLAHTSHPYSPSHALLMEVESASTKLAFVPLTLRFIPSAGIYLHLISSKTAQLQNLLLYVQQCLQRIRTFWKHAQDLPNKFMRNISETLEEKGQGGLVDNLYQLACTGFCTSVLREWLVDELAEAGHKRWDHTVSSSYTTLLQLLHENLLPAVDRCSIVISRLRSLAQYHDQCWIFSAPVTDFTALLTILQNIRLLGHTTLLYAGDEKRQFASFSKWLRYEIDFEATEPGSQSREEMEGKDPGVDIGMVLGYVQYGLTNSDLAPYLAADSQLPSEQRVAPPASYDETRKAIDLLKEGASYKEEALSLEHVFLHLNAGCTKLFHQISQWQEGNINMSSGLVLAEGSTPDVVDMRMVFEPAQTDYISTYIALVPPTEISKVTMHRLTHTPTIGAIHKDLEAYAVTTIHFAPAIVLDVKFADDKSLLVLLETPDPSNSKESMHSLVSLPYTPSPSSSPQISQPATMQHPIPYVPISPTSHASLALPSGVPLPPSARQTLACPPTSEVLKKYTKHVFEGRFAPLRLVVNGRKGRRVVLVLGSDRKHYRVLDLDFKGKKEGDEGDGGVERREEEESSSSDDDDMDVDVEMLGA
ncbi:anaphase-promoting complex, cyclosome, subunit 4-domain-containing protein [Lophiotrema nucula]|uniref:Anaphase-promoting complex subunit 4 n=1 Tax=Lophiotrema nucula TaxID=690887 RepID=A0A6A5ZKS7_9PLEO|nr:anaphase-promoting complex, cyclosome, subunit 4-domain-containing protein [Lophiotrema nucula]